MTSTGPPRMARCFDSRMTSTTPQDDLQDPVETPDVDLVGYEDNGAHVICERSNPNAWIRSTVTVAVTAEQQTERVQSSLD